MSQRPVETAAPEPAGGGPAAWTYDQHYAEGGFGYDEKRAHWVAWVGRNSVREFDIPAGARILDVGCGHGFWTSIFVELGFAAAGVDLSPVGIERARQRSPDAQFAVADAEQPLPFDDESFDVVFCRGISHLIQPELFTQASGRLMANLVRYVRPSGLLLVSVSSTRDGSVVATSSQHTVSDLVRLVERVADPYHVDVVGNYVQIGAQRRDAPRARTSVRGQAHRFTGWGRHRIAALVRRVIRT